MTRVICRSRVRWRAVSVVGRVDSKPMVYRIRLGGTVSLGLIPSISSITI